jgi:DNA-directed RNA polymerase specialized sigma24 family protein
LTVSDYIAGHLAKMKEVCNNVAFKFHLAQDDHFQDCLLVAIRYAESYRDITGTSPNGFMAWWHQLCRNRAIDAFRRNKKAPVLVSEIYGHETEGVGTRYDDRHHIASIYWKVRKKFGSRASVILYMTSHQYQIEDISVHLGMPTGTVKGTVHRIRSYLTPKPLNMAENTENNWVKPVNPVINPPLLEAIPGQSKKCHGKCKLIRAMDEFHRNQNNKDGRQDICKECQSAFMKDYNARKAMERKSQLTAADVSVDKPVVLHLETGEKVNLPPKKVEIKPVTRILKEKKVKLPTSTKPVEINRPPRAEDLPRPVSFADTKVGVVGAGNLSAADLTADEIRDFRTYFVEKRIKLKRERDEIDAELGRIDNLIKKLNP